MKKSFEHKDGKNQLPGLLFSYHFRTVFNSCGRYVYSQVKRTIVISTVLQAVPREECQGLLRERRALVHRWRFCEAGMAEMGEMEREVHQEPEEIWGHQDPRDQ